MPIVEQVGGTHYSASQGKCPHCGGVVQHWDLTANEPYLESAATKYILRHGSKNGFEDLKKAISYVEKRMALDYPVEYAAWKEDTRARTASAAVEPAGAVAERTPWPYPACTCAPGAHVHASDCLWALWMFPPKTL